MNKTALRLVVTLVLGVALAGAFTYSFFDKKASSNLQRKEAQTVNLRGLIALDVEAYLKDPRVVKVLEENQIRLDVTRVGSREMAGKVAGGQGAYDFYFPSGVVAANQVTDAAKKAGLTTTSYSPFYTPMIVASWQPIGKLLVANGLAKAAGEKVYELDLSRLTELMLSKKRWNELANNTDYDVSRSILVSTTDVRKSNSAAMYLALTSYAINHNETLSEREAAKTIAKQVAELFKRQGYQENYVNGNFDDYISIGIGKTPMAFIYENQLVAYAISKKGVAADMALMYPKPTIFNKVMLIAANESAKRLGDILASNGELDSIAIEYGFRTANADAFTAAVSKTGLAVKARVTDVVDPPSYEIMADMIDVITAEMKQ